MLFFGGQVVPFIRTGGMRCPADLLGIAPGGQIRCAALAPEVFVRLNRLRVLRLQLSVPHLRIEFVIIGQSRALMKHACLRLTSGNFTFLYHGILYELCAS
jgi:hypothetical protein